MKLWIAFIIIDFHLSGIHSDVLLFRDESTCKTALEAVMSEPLSKDDEVLLAECVLQEVLG